MTLLESKIFPILDRNSNFYGALVARATAPHEFIYFREIFAISFEKLSGKDVLSSRNLKKYIFKILNKIVPTGLILSMDSMPILIIFPTMSHGKFPRLTTSSEAANIEKEYEH